jgi:hypothetical protein
VAHLVPWDDHTRENISLWFLPFALCPLPFALCPLPFALCPLPFALCPSIFSEEWFEEETCAIFLLLQEITNSEVNQNDCCE